MAFLNPGRLREVVTIQARTVTKDTFGQQSSDWVDVLSDYPAAINGLMGRELLSAQAISAEVSHLIVVRFDLALADPVKVAAMRVLFDTNGVTRIFNIRSSINVAERDRYINLYASEGLNQG